MHRPVDEPLGVRWRHVEEGEENGEEGVEEEVENVDGLDDPPLPVDDGAGERMKEDVRPI